jgi:hypothetical protein
MQMQADASDVGRWLVVVSVSPPGFAHEVRKKSRSSGARAIIIGP